MTYVDPLEGITTRTTKEEILNRLREVAGRLRKQEDTRLDELQAIEARVKAKFANRTTEELRNVIISATATELNDMHEFLSEFPEDMLPLPLKRLLAGSKVLLQKEGEKPGNV